MKNTVEIYVALQNEGAPVWRPVIAERNEDGTFIISDQVMPEDECWEFQPGDVVVAEEQVKGGRSIWVAVRLARPSNVVAM
jgi:hypothetical protein